MKRSLWFSVAIVAALGYVVVSSVAVQDALGSVATSVARPIIIPLIELINVPAFVYCAALAILVAGFAACALYHITALRPSLARLHGMRIEVGSLPQPRLTGTVTPESWAEARRALGLLLERHGIFVAGWSAFQADSFRRRGVPARPFSSFVAAEPGDLLEDGETMRSLPGVFTSVGLIFTFVGLVVALYFAAKGFRSGDSVQAKAAIVQLLNAASFKFLTSVSALVSALLVSLYGRFGSRALRSAQSRALIRIEGYVATWRERVGVGDVGEALAPADLLLRFDALLEGVSALSRDVKRLAERNGSGRLAAEHPALVRPAPGRGA